MKENGDKDDEDAADPDCATVSKKFSFFEHYEEEKGKNVEHKVSRLPLQSFRWSGHDRSRTSRSQSVTNDQFRCLEKKKKGRGDKLKKIKAKIKRN